MQVLWLFQESAFIETEIVQRLIYAAEEIGDRVQVERFLPFESAEFPNLPKDCPIIAHGSIAFVKQAQRKITNPPVAWAPWRELRCSRYYAEYMPDLLLNGRFLMSSMCLLPKQKCFLYNLFGDLLGIHCRPSERKLFIRPDENTKRFSGEVVAFCNFDWWYDHIKSGCDPEDIVVVSPVKWIGKEWRVLIYDKKVVTGSMYVDTGSIVTEPGCPPEVTAFAETCAARWGPDLIYVMDIVETHEGLRLLEIGSFNCAGLYGCDVHKVAAAAHDAAEKTWADEQM
jgi:hypothetical protein